MCVAIVLILILFPLAGAAIGMARQGAAGGWTGAGLGLVLAIVLAGAPAALFLRRAKQGYDRRNRPEP